MIPSAAWVLFGVAVLLLGAPAGARSRTDRLAGGGRLAPVVPMPRAIQLPVVPAWAGRAVAAAVCAAAGGVVGGPVLAVPFAAAGLTGCTLACRAREAQARRRDGDDLLRAVRVLAAELAAGAGPPAALDAAAEPAGRFAPVLTAAAEQVRRGGPASDVLLDGPEPLRPVGHAWRIAEESGAPMAVVFERVAADLVAAVEQRRTVSVALAGPRSSAALLAGLPLLGVALGLTMGVDPFGFLLNRPAGRLVCAAGVGLDLAGISWMARILRRAEASP